VLTAVILDEEMVGLALGFVTTLLDRTVEMTGVLGPSCLVGAILICVLILIKSKSYDVLKGLHVEESIVIV
jgi:hypothetical protein